MRINKILKLLSLGLVLCGMGSLHAQTEKIDQTIFDAAADVEYMNANGDRITVIVVMDPVTEVMNNGWSNLTPAEVQYQMIKRTAEKQWQMRALVSEWSQNSMGPSVRYPYFMWSTNTLVVDASPEAIWEMAQLAEVTRISFNHEVHMTQPLGGEEATPRDGEYTYGLQKIGVPELRSRNSELTGEGVVVGILDTGLDANHPEVRGKMIAWKDFIGGKEEAYDDHGHGTHVAGTIAGEGAGGTQIGIAPRAQLVIGKIFTSGGSSTLGAILEGMEWIANPDRKMNTKLRPRVVNNSWGGGMGSDVRKDPFAQQVINWVQLEIFPSFAAGNSGPGSETIGSPGGLPISFAVGATDASDSIASFSSRGPVKIIDFDGREQVLVKPDISAPGVQILSALPNGRYAKWNGTSMATPHVTGAIAILYQMRPDLTVASMRELLMQSADDLGKEGKDNTFGAGRLNLARAVDMAASF